MEIQIELKKNMAGCPADGEVTAVGKVIAAQISSEADRIGLVKRCSDVIAEASCVAADNKWKCRPHDAMSECYTDLSVIMSGDLCR